MSLPPRSPLIPEPMLVTFDVSCGDALVPGHRVIARGLADQGRSSDDLSGDQTHREECQMVDLVYEIIPAVDWSEAPADRPRAAPIDTTYRADLPLPWSTGGTGPDGLGGPSWTTSPGGGGSTLGGLGPWPVPEGARRLTFWLQSGATGTCGGVLEVDLGDRAARWVPWEMDR